MTTVRQRPDVLWWVDALREPIAATRWSLDEWQQVLPIARRLRLLARLGGPILSSALGDKIPEPVARHLVAEVRMSQWRSTVLTWALDRMGVAFRGAIYPVVLLKGAAYVAQELTISVGRLPSDVDVLVPKAHLADAQRRLTEGGWREVELDEHDQLYYREWSHEVPPMRHPVHPIELDLHHNILPPVARTRVDANRLLARVQPCRWPGWQVLHPIDQVLHSAAHLFLDSEARERARDLVDLDGLLRHFGTDDAFWDELPERARELGLTEPLALACRFCVDWFDTPIPAPVQNRIAALGPSALRRAWLLPMLRSILTPADPLRGAPAGQGLAATVFLARYHLNRMPLRLLVPHLLHKLKVA